MDKRIREAIKRLETRLEAWGRYTCTTQFAEFMMDVHTLIKHSKEKRKSK